MSARRLLVAAAVLGLAAATALPSYADHDRGNGKSQDHKKKRGHSHGQAQAKPSPPPDPCVGNPANVQRLELTVAGESAWGLFALPARQPKGIVVFAHGYGHTAYSWSAHIARTAEKDGVIAVAMNNRKQIDNLSASPRPTSRGWRVAEGAADSIAAAQHFDRECGRRGPGGAKGTNVMYGVSMGGNTSGLAVAAQPKRSDGSPLFDWWFNIEGATNVLQTYAGAKVLALAGNSTGKNAVEDIEAEMGGTPLEQPAAYRERTVVLRADDIARAGLKGVYMAHGYFDGLVGHEHSRQMQVALRARGVPVEFTSVLTRSSESEPGTTYDGYLPHGQKSPFAGHASEVSTTHDVGRAGFTALDALYAGSAPTCRETFVDGATGVRRTANTC